MFNALLLLLLFQRPGEEQTHLLFLSYSHLMKPVPTLLFQRYRNAPKTQTLEEKENYPQQALIQRI